MESEIEKCLLRNTRAAARVMTRRFAEHMREFNVSTEQFSLLASLVGTDHNSVSALAEFLAIERTTLTRNLALLEKKRIGEACRRWQRQCANCAIDACWPPFDDRNDTGLARCAEYGVQTSYAR